MTADDASRRRSLAFLGVPRDAAAVDRAARLAGTTAGVLAAVLGVAFGDVALAVPLAVGVGASLRYAARRAPVWIAAVRRTRSLGAAPGLVGRAVLRMRLEPSLECAVRFAAGTGDGPLADSLGDHARRASADPGSGLRPFVAEWRPWFPALGRAVTRLRAAASAPPERRERSLDRALDAVIVGTTDRMGSFVGDVRGPVSAVYAFGVLLPLALVALLPAARAAGVPLGTASLAATYLVAIPAALLAASGWLLVRRPVAFPPPRIDASHPAVPVRRWHALGVGVAGGALAWIAAGSLVASWSGAVAAAGVGTGAGLVVFARPRRRVLARVRAIESGLADALAIIGGEVAEGVALERAIRRAGEAIDGPTGDVFASAADRSLALRVDAESALCGADGPLADVPSPRVRGAAALLAVAAREGRPAGDVLVELADQLDRLRELERDATRQLATVTRTLANTAAVFGPLVGGATVALAAGMDGGSVTGGVAVEPVAGPPVDGAVEPFPTAVLGRIVGAYVLLLSAILTGLATVLERGLDPTLVTYRVGIAVPTATGTYLVAFVGAGLLL